MTRERKNTGDLGEALAARYLESRGMRILERKYTIRGGEIDLIARDGAYTVFVEVKTRRAGSMVPGELAVTPQKQQKLRLTAESYLLEYPTDRQPRFDVAALIVEGDKLFDFTYYKPAF